MESMITIDVTERANRPRKYVVEDIDGTVLLRTIDPCAAMAIGQFFAMVRRADLCVFHNSIGTLANREEWTIGNERETWAAYADANGSAYRPSRADKKLAQQALDARVESLRLAYLELEPMEVSPFDRS